MNNQNVNGNNPGTCRKPPWYCNYIKPICSFIISILIVLSMSHLCEKLSTNNSFQTIRRDLSSLRNNVNLLSSEVRALTESRDEIRNKLKEVVCIIPQLSQAVNQLKTDFSENIESHTERLLEAMSSDTIRDVVKAELAIYDADKTGKPDFALESLGGSILSTRNTQEFETDGPDLKLFGLTLCKQKNSPRIIIQAEIIPGECWTFKGSQGAVVIQLLGYIRIEGVSIEHIPVSVSPTGDTSTAPKDFSVWALECVDDTAPYSLGSFTYDNSASPVQYFDISCVPRKPYNIVEFKFHSNHGNNTCSCIYRVRVHGTLVHY